MSRSVWAPRILLPLLVLAAISCSGNDGKPPEPGAETGVVEPIHHVRLGYLRIGSDLPFFVGTEAGIFLKHGIEVESHRFPDSNAAAEAILHGQVDATDIIGSAVVLKDAVDHPESFTIFMMSAATESTNIHQLIARKGSGIKSIGDLPGRKLAVFPGTQMRVYAGLFLAEHLKESDRDSVELVPLSPPQQVDAIENGSVDAVLSLEPTGTTLTTLGLGDLVASNVLYENISKPEPFVTAFGIIRAEWIEDNPDAATALVRAYADISQFIAERPDEARQVMARALNLDEAVGANVSLYEYQVVPNFNKNALSETVRLMVESGVLSQEPDIAALIFPGKS